MRSKIFNECQFYFYTFNSEAIIFEKNKFESIFLRMISVRISEETLDVE